MPLLKCDDRPDDPFQMASDWDLLSDSEKESIKRSALSGKEEDYRRIVLVRRSRAMLDFWYFLKEGLFSERAMLNYYEPLHGDRVSKFLSNWTRDHYGVTIPSYFKILKMSRELCKTHIGVAWLAWEYGKNPALRTMIRSHIEDKAEELLAMFKSHVKTNPKYRFIFPWVKPATVDGQEIQWKNERIKLEHNVPGMRESSIEAYGVKGEATGGHYDIQHYDDFVTQTMAESDTLRKQGTERFKHDDNLRSGGTRVLLIGTPYPPMDLFYELECGELAEVDFEMFEQPCVDEVYPRALNTDKIELLDSKRVKVNQWDNIPESLNLNDCQARLLFFDVSRKKNIYETRRIVTRSNDIIVLNRPIPSQLGDPRSLTIGGVFGPGIERPAAPNRHTMDSMDERASNDNEIDKQSLPEKRRKQGAFIFGAQMMLRRMDPKNCLFKREQLRIIEPKSIDPDSPKRWFRTTDLATRKKTTSFTCMFTGFFDNEGPVLTHCHWGQFTTVDNLLEIYLGIIRVIDQGDMLEWTSFEEAALQEAMNDLINSSYRDPYAYFSAMKGTKYEAAADLFLRDRGQVPVRKKTLSRPASKKARISGWLQPVMEQRGLRIFSDMQFIDKFEEELTMFTMESDFREDMLDCAADFVAHGKPPRAGKETGVEVGLQFNQIIRRAERKGAITSHSSNQHWSAS